MYGDTKLIKILAAGAVIQGSETAFLHISLTEDFMWLVKPRQLSIAIIMTLALATTLAHAQQWQGPSGPNGAIWRLGHVALGFEPRTGVTDAVLELNQPLAGERELLLSAGTTFKSEVIPRLQVDTERVYVGGARSKASLLWSGIDIAIHGTAAIGTRSLSERLPTDYALIVGGKILAEEVRVKLVKDWADYAFKPGYALRSLEDVERFIQTNQHLPDLPSAAEVSETGVGLGTMQSKLLLKIEELTLHMIQQHKTIEQLRQELTTLKAATNLTVKTNARNDGHVQCKRERP